MMWQRLTGHQECLGRKGAAHDGGVRWWIRARDDPF